MRLINHGHACVRIEDDGRVLVVDPGLWSDPDALDGAGEVLITHEHADHIDADRLAAAVKANPDLTIHTHPDVAEQLRTLGDAVRPIRSGEIRTVAGFYVEAVGGEHAEIYDGLPGCGNLGFLIDAPRGVVYHPGDSLYVPDARVGTLLVPASAPWLKLAEAIEFMRAIKPHRAHPIHDAILSDLGQSLVDRWLDGRGGAVYSRIPVGESVEI